MSAEVITKRLHISGLTPAITPTDLSARLSTFGQVKDLAGFGQLDAVGRPRKFGYVTIETTKPQLAKCMNILSGSTWKGAKLRLGEAKPDYKERIEKEKLEEGPPKKRRRRAQGTFAQDMSLVTPENVKERPGWRVTPLGRIVRPLRMRPGKPLPETTSTTATKATKGKAVWKSKRKQKMPLVRARRRTIDPTKWGSTYLKGAFLDVQERVAVVPRDLEEEVDEDGSSSGEDGLPIHTPPVLDAPSNFEAPHDLVQEKNQTLSFLHNLFGDKDDAWIGTESVGSDIDVDERPGMELGEETHEIEEVPMDAMSVDVSAELPLQHLEIQEDDKPDSEKQPTTQTKLKDLFAPREEEAGFSLFGHLDLDLELDEEVLDISVAPVPTSVPEPVIVHTPQFNLDSTKPLFFPPGELMGSRWRTLGFFRRGNGSDGTERRGR